MSRATKNRKVDRRTVYDWVQQVLSDDGLDQSSGLTGRICDALGIEQRYPSPTFTIEELKVNEWDFSPLVRACSRTFPGTLPRAFSRALPRTFPLSLIIFLSFFLPRCLLRCCRPLVLLSFFSCVK